MRYFSTLLPVKNILEASIYALALMHRGNEEETLKLDYLARKQISDDFFGSNKVNQMVYCKNIPKEGMQPEQ